MYPWIEHTLLDVEAFAQEGRKVGWLGCPSSALPLAGEEASDGRLLRKCAYPGSEAALLVLGPGCTTLDFTLCLCFNFGIWDLFLNSEVLNYRFYCFSFILAFLKKFYSFSCSVLKNSFIYSVLHYKWGITPLQEKEKIIYNPKYNSYSFCLFSVDIQCI